MRDAVTDNIESSVEVETINILVVEDDDSQIELYKTCIDEKNLESDIVNINAIFEKNGNNLESILDSIRIDTLIVDLNLGVEDIENSGNDIIEKVYLNKRIPIFVVSGDLNKLRERRAITDVYRQYTRDEVSFYEILDEIEKLFLSGYTKIFGYPGMIDDLLNDVFWKYASSNITTWCVSEDKELRDRRFLRFITARMNEQFHYYNGCHDAYNSIEFYIYPPNSECFFNGDIVLYDEKHYLVMTPSCDIENSKCDKIMLCEVDFNKFRSLRETIKTTEVVSKTLREKLRKLINNYDKSIHFLPPTVFFEGGIVDFSKTKDIDIGVFEEMKTLKYRISHLFMKDIINRFSLYLKNSENEELCQKSDYFSKQGQPEIDIEEIIRIIKKEESY